MKHIKLTIALLLLSVASFAISPIGGTMNVCLGSTALLTDATSGGTWMSSDPSIASVDITTGIVTGNAAGITTISYTVSASFVTATVTVNSTAPAPITGSLVVCMGLATTLTDATPGGVWSSNNTAIVYFSGPGAGVATGVSPGTTTISYVLPTGCSVSAIMTVNPAPAIISGSMAVCVGYASTLNDASAGGVWNVAAPSIATISSTTGVYTGVSSGTTVVTYTLPATGCVSTAIVTVNTVAASITGTASVCVGGTTALSDATGGGTWSSTSGIATVSSGGVVTGVALGTTTISYTISTGCSASVVVTVNSGAAVITGITNLCVGGITTLSDATGGGTWVSGATAVATVSSSGVVFGISAGTAVITYGTGGCNATTTVTVNPAPGPVTGTLSVCAGSTTALSDVSVGGTWVTSGPGTATVGSSSGLVTGISAGTTTISYILSATGCSSQAVVTVNPLPAAITGTTSVCIGGTTTLMDGVSGGIWSCSSPIVTISGATGVVTGVSAGTAIVTYTIGTGCYTTTVVTASALPAAITGTTSVCAGGGTTTLSDVTGGGVWVSSGSSTATVGSGTGVVTGVAAGTVTISYMTIAGCATTTTVTVNGLPVVYAMTGGGSICAGGTGLDIALSGSDAGVTYVLYCDAVVVSSITGTGSPIDFGLFVAPGTYTIVASNSLTSCASTMSGSAVITTIPLPTITASSSTASCGGVVTFTAGGGTTYSWSPTTGLSCGACSSPTLSPSGAATYTVTGTDASGCTNTATVSVTGNSISGHIGFGSGMPGVPDCKVWLIQFNPTDSSLTAEDSMVTCTDGVLPYYEFDGKPAGSYMVKAKLLSAVAGTSDYMPTYSLSAAHWDIATPITHAAAADSMHIDMIYGTVPAGPGFIGGFIVSGAGKGTSGDVPVVGMQVYLLNTASNVLTYVYTDATGAYAFNGLANGSYVIYPEAYDYSTTPSVAITLSTGTEAINAVNFKQHTTSGTITPYDNTIVKPVPNTVGISVYPNPATNNINVQWENQHAGIATVTLSDITGREVYHTTIAISASGNNEMNVTGLKDGLYIISIRGAGISYTGKVQVQQ